MRILALDLSSKTGFSVWESATKGNQLQPLSQVKLVAHGLLTIDKPILAFEGKYPFNVKRAAWAATDLAINKALDVAPDVIVIEDTVPGRQALSQRFLEWMHYSFLACVETEFSKSEMPEIVYLRTGSWRKAVGLKGTKADAKNNKVAKKIKELKINSPGLAKTMAKQLGVRGKIGKKHQAVRMVNEMFGLSFKVKDNDIADSILLGLAFIQGAAANDGT